jgi:hypothetical protein
MLDSAAMAVMICCPTSGGTSPAATAANTCSTCWLIGKDGSKSNCTRSPLAFSGAMMRDSTSWAALESPSFAFWIITSRISLALSMICEASFTLATPCSAGRPLGLGEGPPFFQFGLPRPSPGGGLWFFNHSG